MIIKPDAVQTGKAEEIMGEVSIETVDPMMGKEIDYVTQWLFI